MNSANYGDKLKEEIVEVEQPALKEADPEVVFCQLDPHPLPLSYRHEDDSGMHYDGNYHARARVPMSTSASTGGLQ